MRSVHFARRAPDPKRRAEAGQDSSARRAPGT
jgi:hypothetical protein